jgi:hypothetical protein
MTIKSTATMLEEVQTAITTLMSGARSVTIDGITYSQDSVQQLQQREETLFRRLNQSNLRKRTTPDFG